ncbi:MAG: hypothetical protein QXV66_00260 [Candidatus Rehaiarchaeum fermentans]|nr:hypothetical protein [Candidatus Rehaiarchaeum fermentans]
MLEELGISVLIAFLITLIVGNYLRKILVSASITAIDRNKKEAPTLPASGGLVLLVGLTVGISAFIFESSIVKNDVHLINLALFLAAASIATFVGFLDDVVTNRIRNLKRKISKQYLNGGLSQKEKPIWSIIAIIPILAMSVPPAGTLFGINIKLPLYIFVILEGLTLLFTTNAVNMLEGLNGLALQTSGVAILFLVIYSIITNNPTAYVTGILIIATIAGYLYYGVYPAKILPGDSLTYLLGISLGTMIFLSRGYTLGLILLIPWIIEFILKARARFHAHSFGIIQKDGTLKSFYGNKIYSLTHIFYQGKFKEWQITGLITLIEILLGLIGILLSV